MEPEGVVVRSNGTTTLNASFPEAKDLIGGYTTVEADSLQAAIALTSGCPALDIGGSVEVRPVLDTSRYE